VVIDRRSDLSALFLLHGASLLSPAGALAFVLPASLFQARYGKATEAALAATGKKALQVESMTHRTFADVDVNTAILLASSRRHGDLGPGFQRVDIEGRPDGSRAAPVWATTSPEQRCETPTLPCRDRLVPLARLGRLRYPIKSGINRFFYPDSGTVAAFGIEPRYLRPVLKSPREVDRICLAAESLRGVAFVLGDEPGVLQPGAARYVAWGSRQVTNRGIRWPDVASVRARKQWFALPLPAGADVLCPRFFDRRLFFVVPDGDVVEDQTFYGLILAPEQRENRELIAALLTCSFSCLSLEMHGRTGLGDGVRQYALGDLAALPVPDPGRVSAILAAPLVDAFRAVADRPILPVEEEMRSPDRVSLDAIAGQALGLPAGVMQAVRDEVAERVDRRLRRARSLPREHGTAAG
jgi:hypothetical protein